MTFSRKTPFRVFHKFPLPITQKTFMNPQTPCHFRNLPPSLNNQPYCFLLKLLVKYPPVVLYFHSTPPRFSFYITNLSVCPLNRGRFKFMDSYNYGKEVIHCLNEAMK